jgi:holliday junction DNA helicase RuvB
MSRRPIMTNRGYLRVAGYAARHVSRMMPVDFAEQWEKQTGISLTTGRRLRGGDETFAPVDLDAIFATGQPDCLFEGEGMLPYRGQDLAKRRINLYVRGLKRDERRKFFFTGPAGTGKTTLARIVARMMQAQQAELGLTSGGYYELLPAQVAEKGKLDEFMQAVVEDDRAIVFIDEVHTLTNIENMFHVLHETGELWYPMADGSRLAVPRTISWFAGTTDKGEADKTTGGALLRRLEPEISLEPLTKDDIAAIVLDQAEKDGLEMRNEAAFEVADRVMFPWEAKDLVYKEAKLVAEVEGIGQILPNHVREAFEMLQIDDNGLRRDDREVIRTLLRVNDGKGIALVTKPGVTRYRMDEQSLCSTVGIDRTTYGKRVKPKLMAKGYLIPIQGQCLTDKALAEYGWLR